MLRFILVIVIGAVVCSIIDILLGINWFEIGPFIQIPHKVALMAWGGVIVHTIRTWKRRYPEL